ncbi:MAG: hypothetical protein Q9217_000171 [Psora testacea]
MAKKKRSTRRSVREMFRKRSQSFFRKGNELAQKTAADVYIVIRQNNKYSIYKSRHQPAWPPSEQDIMNHSPSPFRRGPEHFPTASEETEDEEQEGAQTEEPDRTQPEEPERARPEESGITQPRQSCRLRNGENIVGQGRRVFTIPKPPVLQLSPIMEGFAHR